jgi:hypothetical protein
MRGRLATVRVIGTIAKIIRTLELDRLAAISILIVTGSLMRFGA